MTAEIVVLNLNAVALAADSAGTFSNSKINNSMNKLYMLAPNHDVGLMIYNNAAFMGMPWELIINDFRNKLVVNKGKYSRLQDYITQFINHIHQNIQRYSSPEVEEQIVLNVARDLFLSIRKSIWDTSTIWVQENSKEMPEEKMLEIAIEVVKKTSENFRNNRGDCKWMGDPKLFKEEFLNTYRSGIQIIKRELLQQFPFSDDEDQKLTDLVLDYFSMHLPNQKDFSGIVVTGFGKDEIYPKYYELFIASALCQKLRYQSGRKDEVDVMRPAAICGFAQDDVFRTIIFGRHPAFINSLRDELSNNEDLFPRNQKDRNQKILEIIEQMSRQS